METQSQIFQEPLKDSQVAYFAEHTGVINKVQGHNKGLAKFLFQTHILFKRKKDVEKIVKSFGSIEEVFDAEKNEKPVKKFFGVISNLSNLFSVLSALPVIFKIVIVILGLIGVTGISTFMGKKVEEGNTEQVKKKFEKLIKKDPVSIGKKYGILLGKYKDLRGYTITVYDIDEDKKNRQVWVYSYDQYGSYFCDTLSSFHQILDYKYAGKRTVLQYYTKIAD